MTYYDDLSPCDYVDRKREFGVLAVGWLSSDEPYTRGPVPSAFTMALDSLLSEPYVIGATLGSHLCEFCAPRTAHPADLRHPHGSINIVVPGERALYVCPSLIAHYVDAHGYRPPDAFVTAVLECPDMGSEEYFRRLLAVGGSVWREQIEQDVRFCTSLREHLPFQSSYSRELAEKWLRHGDNMQRALRSS